MTRGKDKSTAENERVTRAVSGPVPPHKRAFCGREAGARKRISPVKGHSGKGKK